MRKFVYCAVMLLFVSGLFACGGGGGGTGGAVTATQGTEVWGSTVDGGQGSGHWTGVKNPDGSITASGSWQYSYGGGTVTCPFTSATVTVNGSNISFTATGTATYTAAPPGYQTSPFTLTVNGTAASGQGSGTSTTIFSNPYWQPYVSTIASTWTSQRQSGSGITSDTQNTTGGGATGTITIKNGESGTTVREIYIVPKGESWGSNLLTQGQGIGYNDNGMSFSLPGNATYSIKVSTSESLSILNPTATADLYLANGDNKQVLYTQEGGSSYYWSELHVQ